MSASREDSALRPAGSGPLLGVDLGLTNTVALLRRPDGRSSPLLFDGEPVLPSCVLLGADGSIRVGRDAERAAAADPDHFEPAPRRHIAEQKFRLGERDTTPTDLLAGVLAAVAASATATLGSVPPAALTYPVRWAAAEQATLREAARYAGFADVTLIPEPVAAVAAVGASMAVERRLVVVDVGARGFDVSVLAPEAGRLAVVAVGGDPTVGGRRIDAAIAAHIAAAAGRQRREIWRAIDRPRTIDQRRTQREFWADVRAAKETLDEAEFVPVSVPGTADIVPLTRSDMERFARPVADRVARVTARVLREARVTPAELDAIVLVGGSAPLPTLWLTLRDTLGIEPVQPDPPAFAMAGGALGRLAADLALPVGTPAAVGAAAMGVPRPPRVVAPPRLPVAGGVFNRAAKAAARLVRRPVAEIAAPPRRAALPAPRQPEDGLPGLSALPAVRRSPGVPEQRRVQHAAAHRDPSQPYERAAHVWGRFGWFLVLLAILGVLAVAMAVLAL
ncbi:Hsp70 family protein [Cryptosporangium sp. NPDC048952]|uniref:Hsp70 family protein n=1 Tax=Cryptosporangium sp. NPDC048952 TaxID=3363961 RepID=UPI0037155518